MLPNEKRNPGEPRRGGPTLLAPVAAAAAIGTLALGLLVIAGWHLHVLRLVQVLPGLAPMQYNAAICLAASGLGLLAMQSFRERTALVCGTVVAAIGLVTLAEYLVGANFGIDELFLDHYLTVETSHPGRMAPNAAVGFVLMGAALMVGVRELKGVPRYFALALFGSIVVGLAAVVLSNYLSMPNPDSVYRWGELTRMAVHTSVGLILLGVGAIAFAWDRSTAELGESPRWLPLPVAVAIATTALCFWQALKAHEERGLADRVAKEVGTVLSAFEARLESRINALVRMGQRWEVREGMPKEEWLSDAALYVLHQAEFVLLEWIDDSSQVRWVVPTPQDAPDAVLNESSRLRRRQALDSARTLRRPVVSRPLDWPEISGGFVSREAAALPLRSETAKAFLICVPLFVNEHFDGCIVGTIKVEALASVIRDGVGENFAVVLERGSEEIYRLADPGSRPNRWTREVESQIGGDVWRIQIWPSSRLVARMHSFLPEATLAFGLALACLVGTALSFAQTARLRAVQLNARALDLEQQIAWRHRAESELSTALEELQQRSQQLRRLNEAALAMNPTRPLDTLLQEVTERSRHLIGAHQATTSLTVGENWSQAITGLSLSDKYADYRDYDAKPDGSGIYSAVCETNHPMRMTQIELEGHPRWKGFGDEADKHPPLRGWLAVPLIDSDGKNLGLMQVSDRYDGDFTAEDEEALMQLAQLTSTAVELHRSRQDLEDRVEERTLQLQQRAEELERFNRLAVGREHRMIELKREINALARQLGDAPAYELAFADLKEEGGR